MKNDLGNCSAEVSAKIFAIMREYDNFTYIEAKNILEETIDRLGHLPLEIDEFYDKLLSSNESHE